MFRSSISHTCLLIGLSAALIAGCTHDSKTGAKTQNPFALDRELGYDRHDYRNMLAPRPAPEAHDQSNVPDLAPVIAENKNNILPQPLVSISVNQDVPIRDIFFELAKQAEVDLELDPTITGSIIFTAYNRPFDQVVSRISDMAGLRYKFKNNILRVERDTPYMKTYRMDYLSVQREYTSTISSNTSAATGSSGGSGGGGGSSGGGENGSSSTITSTSSSDFWNELETNITQIIANTNRQVAIMDQNAAVSTPHAIPALPVTQLATNMPQGEDASSAPSPSVQQQALAQMQVQQSSGSAAPAVAGLANPTGQPAAGGAAGAAGGAGGAAANPYFSVNRQAGLINVFATEKQHKQVAEYLIEMRRAINTQVLIEAKVFEVELNDESSLGIDWEYIGSSHVAGSVNLPRQSFVVDPVGATEGSILTFNSGNFNGMISAINRFGTIRTLSSPRLTVMNNQTAVLNVTESRVFFTIEIDRTEGTQVNPASVDISTEINNVPEGVIITVHPSVDPDTNEITMNLRPSITRVVRTVSDPGVRMMSGGEIESFVPELSIREIDSIVKMASGSTVIMGGLMQDRVDSRQVGVPVLSEIPLVGAAFRNQRDAIRKTEMVIMLRAVVVDQARPDKTDREIYKNMAEDRHPLPL